MVSPVPARAHVIDVLGMRGQIHGGLPRRIPSADDRHVLATTDLSLPRPSLRSKSRRLKLRQNFQIRLAILRPDAMILCGCAPLSVIEFHSVRFHWRTFSAFVTTWPPRFSRRIFPLATNARPPGPDRRFRLEIRDSFQSVNWIPPGPGEFVSITSTFKPSDARKQLLQAVGPAHDPSGHTRYLHR